LSPRRYCARVATVCEWGSGGSRTWLSWILADIAAYADDLRRPHREGGDAEDALTYVEAGLRMP
jgi:hypothetical protein